MKLARDTSQSMQRVKVGLIGLAAVVLLIGIASAIMRTVNRERPVTAVGAPQAAVVAKMGIDNGTAPSGEPLAEMGVTASTANSAAAQ